MKVSTDREIETTVAMRIAGEDIACGDYVTEMSKVIELPSCLWDCSSSFMDLEEPVRIKFASAEAGQPLKVFAVCLPFVYAKKPCGAIVVLDTRLRQLVRLNHDCAKMVWKELKAQAEGKLKLL